MKNKKILLIALVVVSFIGISNKSNERTNYPRVLYQNRASTNVDEYFNTYSAPDTFGSKVGSIIEYNDKYYQNYSLGYVELKLENQSPSFVNYAGRNISGNGNLTKVSLSSLISSVGERFATAGNDNFGASLDNPNLVKDVISQKMKEVYETYYNNDIILGTVGSDVKAWDGFIVQDFYYGDSSFAFDSERYKGSFIFYNYRLNEKETKGECFVVSDMEAEYWDKNKTTLGYPTSNLTSKEIILPGSTTKRLVAFQTFEGGFTYRDPDNLMLVYRNGFTFDSENNVFIAKATPKVDSRYGKFIEEFANEDETKVVKVYQKGSIICTLDNGEYDYEYRPARIYKSLTEYEMYDVNAFIEEVGNTFESSYDNEKEISLKLKKKFKDLYKEGFFVGFKESSFHGNWNGVDAQQFILGDSTANPWDGDRTNVAALVYNEKDNKVVLLANNPLYLWDKDGNFNTYGSPLDDAFKVGNDVFQKFEGGLLVVLNDNADTAFLYKGTYEEYVEGKKAYQKPTFGNEFTGLVKVDSNPVVYVLAIGVPSIVVISGIGLIVYFNNKKKKNERE